MRTCNTLPPLHGIGSTWYSDAVCPADINHEEAVAASNTLPVVCFGVLLS